jgi:NADH dehydrogenase/NADH:ubiquinone oxidoreductase subunit G
MYKRTSRAKECTQHYIREDALKQLVLKQLQHFLSYLQQFERVFIRQQIDATLAERRYELSAKQKQIEKDEKRIKELDRLFRKIYEDNVNGKLNDERFYKLSDGYEAEQEQLKQEIEALTAEVSEADTEATNVAKLIAVTKKYTRIDELTPEVLNAFVDKIVIHEREKKDGKRTQQIDIHYSYVGIVDIPTDEEMRQMEREYMQRTKRQTA